MVTLGEKIKMFRLDSGISQFNLETALDLGYGSISRMESNQTIPTRPTLKKIAQFLKLNDRKFDYLIGSRIQAPTPEDINYVIKLMGDVWENPNIFLLLRDDHFRLCAASKGIKNALNVTEEMWEKKYNLRNIAAIAVDPDLPLHNAFDPKLNRDAVKDLKMFLVGFYYELSYLKLESDYQEAMKEIKQSPLANSILEEIYKTKIYPSFFLINDRQLKIFVKGKELDLSFYTEVIPDSTRFSFIHLFPRPSSF